MPRLKGCWSRRGSRGRCGFAPIASCPTTGTSCFGRERDGELAAFMQQLTTRHVRRWQLHRRTSGLWACLPKPIQVVSGRGRRVFLSVCALCGAQRVAGGLGRARRGVEVVQSLATDFRHGGAKAVAQPLARALSARLVQIGQRAANGGGGGGDPSLRGPRPTLRRRGLGPPDGRTTRAGIDAASTASSKKGCPPSHDLPNKRACPPFSSKSERLGKREKTPKRNESLLGAFITGKKRRSPLTAVKMQPPVSTAIASPSITASLAAAAGQPEPPAAAARLRSPGPPQPSAAAARNGFPSRRRTTGRPE